MNEKARPQRRAFDLGDTMITENLIDRLNAEVARRMTEKARARRLDALASLPRDYIATVTLDGQQTREITFDRPPTVEDLADAAPNHFVVAVRMARRSLRERVRQAIAAE
jgi:hypothetical protein